MNFILIVGPPAVGKMTVGQELGVLGEEPNQDGGQVPDEYYRTGQPTFSGNTLLPARQ